MSEKEYNIGLDIGVGSVGWCVTDIENNLLKRGNKNMWGSRIFSGAQTAKKTRTFRSARRRLERRKNRVAYLQAIFRDEMEKEHPNFFPLLRETSSVKEDKSISTEIDGIKYNLFYDKDSKFTDKEYYKKFPTIYHLRNFLVNSTEKQDIRLVYLAIHHIIKYRGNFLYEGDFNNSNEIENDLKNILDYLKENYDIELKTNENDIKEKLTDNKMSKSEKVDELLKCFKYTLDEKQVIKNILNSFLGKKFYINKVFNCEIEKDNISFSEEVENEDEILNAIQENADTYNAMKSIYRWTTLQNILKGKKYISEAFIDKYEKYKKDLFLLKSIYKEYYKNEYNDFFRNERDNNYVHYNGKQIRTIDSSCNNDKFFDEIKRKINELPDDYENFFNVINENYYNKNKKYIDSKYKDKNNIVKDIDNNSFLAKLNVTANGAIPHQLHQKELEQIIDNQGKFYPFLIENKEKILKIFYTRIPYYVGPLTKNDKQSKFSWVIRKDENNHIRPWNLEDVIDVDSTAEKFIERLTNRCTYLLTEPVIPKQSILYSEFCVLEELNNIRINEEHVAEDTKRKIIDKLFKVKTKVTKKDIEELLYKDGFSKVNVEGISNGEGFNSNLKSYIDMCKIFGKVDDENINMCEQIIYYVTIFEDRSILKRKLKNELKLEDETITRLMKLKYSGWSKLSKKLLLEIKDYNGDSIMDKLRNTSANFMQIINDDRYAYKKELERYIPEINKKVTYNDVAEIPTSPANKRAIWQTIKVVEEIEKVMKCEPKNIYIEFARGEEKDKKLRDTRAKDLLKKYEKIQEQIETIKNYDNKVYKELKQHQTDKDMSERLYLYFIQNGKSLYSQTPLNIDELDKYEVDHIIPRSLICDNSLDNKALVLHNENQDKKENYPLRSDIVDRNIIWWKNLYENGLISSKKYYNIIRKRPLTSDDLKRFTKRQIVETRQITKYVANLLNNSSDNIKIFTLRAELTHLFRLKYDIYKDRDVNDYHHAQDAYIISTIGNTLDKEWHGLEKFIYGDYEKYNKYDKKLEEQYQENKKNEEKYAIIGFVNKRIDISKIKKTMNYKDYYISRMLEENTGEFYNQTIQKANKIKNKKSNYISLKNNKDPEKYGRYTGENKAYCVIYSYINEENKINYEMTGILIKIAYDIKNKKTSEEKYIENTYLKGKNYNNFKIIKKKVLIGQEYIDIEDKMPKRLCSDSEIRPDKQLIIDANILKLIYNMKRNKISDDAAKELSENYIKIYDYLLEKLNNEFNNWGNVYDKLLNLKDTFSNLTEDKKKNVINGLISLMANGQGNLKDLGLGDRVGRKSGITFDTQKLLNMIFVNKSVTGMYERRYKINGMENNSSK